MDRNTIIGIVMILVVIIGFSIINQPSEEELAEAQRKRDSIEAVQQKNAAKRAIEDEERRKLEQAEKDSMATLLSDTSSIVANDSIVHSRLAGKYGVFADAANGEEELFTIENNLLKATLTTKGGKLKRVELKNYKTFDSLPLVLFDGDSTVFGLKFFTENKGIHTNDLFFTSSDAQNIVIDESPKSISMKLMVDESKYIEYQYTVHPDDYMIDFNVNLVGMDDVISKNISYIDLDWKMYVRPQEKGRINENNFTSLFYKYYEDDVDQLSERSDDEEELKTSIKWVAYKQQFFSTVLIANDAFTNGSVHQTKFETGDYLKYFESTLALNYKGMQNETLPMRIYMGPNRYNTLTKYNLELEHMIPLGWGFFLLQWINRFAVIPVFNFLEGFIGNYGIIILILTILLKLVLFPLTYKSYRSTAKMRVLKPQIDEINKKFPKEKAMERQQATMALYKKVGVSPMGGCLPMLVQFPILIAMFRFFPASIELRQQSFLWADDLSTYDSVWDLSFDIPWYGDHVSLFTILMTISTLIYTHMQQKTNPTGNQMPGMKYMMYLFPIMFLFFLNSYASGLSYYYFVANMITFGQMALIKKFTDDDAILAKLEQNKKKPAKKSNFQSKLEKMAKERGYKPPKK